MWSWILPIIVTYDVAPKELELLEKELASISKEAVQNCFFVCISSSISDCGNHMGTIQFQITMPANRI